MSVDRSPEEDRVLREVFERYGDQIVVTGPLDHKRQQPTFRSLMKGWTSGRVDSDSFDPSIFGGSR